MWDIKKIFLIEFVIMLFLFYVLDFFFFAMKCGILASQAGIKPAPPTLKGEVSTTGPPGKSLFQRI